MNAVTSETLHEPVGTQGSPPAAGTVEASYAQDSHPERLPLRRVELLLIFGFWTLIAILTTANSLLDPPTRRGLQPVSAFAPVAMAFAESYMWAVVTPLIFRLGSRYTIERANWISRVLLFVGVGLVIAILFDVVTGWLRWHVVYQPRPLSAFDVQPVERLWRLRFMNDFIVYVAVVSAAFARGYFLRYRARREEAINLQTQAAQLQAQLADARLAALRSQLNPHFLFNTLHAISALVERDPRGVRRMIARLSELLRATLEGAEEQEIPLRQETAFIDRYLEIMQIRFQGRLEVDTQIEPEALEALVPNLILQPLVENAVKHGVSKLEGIGRIAIAGRRDGGRIVLSVRDNGPAFQGEMPQAAEGVGLRNTRARLTQLYGSDQSLMLRAGTGGGLVAEVSFPYHTRADLHTAAVASGR